MKEKKSIKTYADNSNLKKVIKAYIDDPYFMEVMYYYVRRSLLEYEFNLKDVDGFDINGKYLGEKIEVDFTGIFNNVLKSLGFALSIRALMLNSDYIKKCYGNSLLFNSVDSSFISWDSHEIIMECIGDDDFSLIYQMMKDQRSNGRIDDKFKIQFKERTVRPEFHHLEDYCKILADDPTYHGQSVIKNNAFLCSDIEEFTITKAIDYVGNTAFAYCENLECLIFEGKVIFGKFPIIECKNLKRIIVPTNLLDYYKETLPYYKDIITDRELDSKESDIEVEVHDLEIEHVYVDVPSANSYIETEVEADEAKEITDYTIIRKAFDKKATSYKYFWFLAILKLYKENGNNNIKFKDILKKMVSSAWKYVFVENSVFPTIDQIPITLSKVGEKCALSRSAKETDIEYSVLEYYKALNLDSLLTPLLKNVPYRFLSPWIPFTDNEEVVAKSNNPDTKCPYALHDDHITIYPIWGDYFLENYDKLTQFAEKELRLYLKIR